MNNPFREPRYLDRAVNAIFQMTKKNTRREISVKSIRRFKDVDGANKSAVAFYSKALIFLAREGVLEVINHNSPKKYGLKDKNKLKILSKAKAPM